MNEHDAVMATLDEYAVAYCSKDLTRLMAIFVEGDEVSLIGTGADELCSGRDAIASIFARNFEEATAQQFEWLWKDISIHGDAATVAVNLNIHLVLANDKVIIPIRWTVSLVKIETQWKWVHRHASAAAGTQSEGSAYPAGNN